MVSVAYVFPQPNVDVWMVSKTDVYVVSLVSHPPSFVSRVPNTAVLHRACCNAASDMLVQRQLLLFDKVLRSPLDHPLHVSAFIPGTLQPATSRYVRRVGRPRREWVSEVSSRVFDYFGGHREVTRLVHDPAVWYRTVRQAISAHAPRGV